RDEACRVSRRLRDDLLEHRWRELAATAAAVRQTREPERAQCAGIVGHLVGHHTQRIIQYAFMTIDAVTPPLAGRAMLVTGASSGIGRAIAVAAARAGADVAITYRVNEDGARAVEREIRTLGRRAATLRLDLADD